MKKLGTGMQKVLGRSTFSKLTCILLSIFHSSCSQASPGVEAVGKFSNSFSKEIEKSYGLRTIASGVSFPVKIKWVHLSFSSSSSISIEEGRKLIVSITNLFIQRMNEDENLRKYLANNPASLTNVDLTLVFKDNAANPLNSIMVIGSKNLVVYNKYNETRTILLDLHEESFDEAEKIVQQAASSSSISEPSNDK